jgi:hypothetical protein
LDERSVEMASWREVLVNGI